MASQAGFENSDEFWPFYVSQHLRRSTRRLHFAGTTAGLACLVACVLTQNALLIPLGLVVSYGLAWIGHFFFEKNSPATFQHPIFSLRADFRMYGLMWRGQMEAEIARLKGQMAPYVKN